MKMSTIFTIVLNYPKIIHWRIRYYKKIKIDIIQFFGRFTTLKIVGNSKVKIERGTQSRHSFSIIAENGVLAIGNNCFFNNNCSITCLEQIEIGNNCSFGNNVVILDHDHDYKHITNNLFITSPVKIGNNVWIGANCVILKGVIIGDNCVVAAGSIVRGDIESNTLYYQKRENINKHFNIR